MSGRNQPNSNGGNRENSNGGGGRKGPGKGRKPDGQQGGRKGSAKNADRRYKKQKGNTNKDQKVAETPNDQLADLQRRLQELREERDDLLEASRFPSETWADIEELSLTPSSDSRFSIYSESTAALEAQNFDIQLQALAKETFELQEKEEKVRKELEEKENLLRKEAEDREKHLAAFQQQFEIDIEDFAFAYSRPLVFAMSPVIVWCRVALAYFFGSFVLSLMSFLLPFGVIFLCFVFGSVACIVILILALLEEHVHYKVTKRLPKHHFDPDLRADAMAMDTLKHYEPHYVQYQCSQYFTLLDIPSAIGGRAPMSTADQIKGLRIHRKTDTSMVASIELMSQILISRNIKDNVHENLVYEHIQCTTDRIMNVGLNKRYFVKGHVVEKGTNRLAGAYYRYIMQKYQNVPFPGAPLAL